MKIGCNAGKLLAVLAASTFLAACGAVLAQTPPAGEDPSQAEQLAEKRARILEQYHALRADPHEPPTGGVPRVLFGADDRIDVYETTDANLLKLAAASCVLVDTSEISLNPDGSYDLTTSPYLYGEWGPGDDLCPNERYYGDDTIGFCSGFLVGTDLVATAGHCISAADCGSTAFIFDFKKPDAATPPQTSHVSADNIYHCAQVVVSTLAGDSDHALVRLDRPVVGRQPLPIRRTGAAAIGDALVMVGHPRCLPIKIAGGAQVKFNVGSLAYFESNLDAYGGNSGSMVVNVQSMLVEGILVRGSLDYDFTGTCELSLVCSDQTGCNGMFEEVSKISALIASIPAQPGESPPLVQSVTPARGATPASLPVVGVVFTEPVTGVSAGLMTVGGSAAVTVTGGGAGPYWFSGFAAPPYGAVAVALSGAGVKDVDNLPFTGDQWQYTLEPPVPPHVQSVTPAVDTEVAQLPSIDVTFDRAVFGVTAAALTINGAPAVAVSGGGIGPYRFTGWPAVHAGAINVVLNGKAIHDGANTPTPDKAWTYQIRDCNNNGVADGLDIAANPGSDCNGNGVPDDCEAGALIISIGQAASLKLDQQVALGGQPTATGGLTPYTYSWNLPGNTFGATSTAANPQFAASLPGTYVITLTVTDGLSCTKNATLTITVSTDAPGAASLGGCGAGCGPGLGVVGIMALMWTATWSTRRWRRRR